MNPNSLNITEILKDTKFTNFFVNKTTDIIKCFVTVNFNIKNKIPYYYDEETTKIIFEKHKKDKKYTYIDIHTPHTKRRNPFFMNFTIKLIYFCWNKSIV